MKNGVENALPTPGGGNGKSWQLSLYDQHRTPHEPITDGTEITVSPRSLNSELMCPICLDMLKNTMTTKECLHRFCQECITTALRSGNKECPTCRKKLISKRSLRPDPNFDALISKLYPDRKEYEAMQERALARLSKHYNTEALQKSIEEGMKLQAQLRKMHRVTNMNASSMSQDECERRAKRRKRDDNSRRQSPDRESSLGDLSASETSATRPSKSRASEVELILKPHPETERSSDIAPVAKQTRYLKTTANATIDHLATYLAIRIKLDTDDAMRNNMETSLEAFDKVKPFLAAPSASATPAITDSVPEDAKVSPSLADQPKKEDQSPEIQSQPRSEERQPSADQPPSNAEPKEQYTIFVEQGGNSGNLVLLSGNLNLEAILSKYWAVKRPLELLFLVPAGVASASASRSSSDDENTKPDMSVPNAANGVNESGMDGEQTAANAQVGAVTKA